MHASPWLCQSCKSSLGKEVPAVFFLSAATTLSSRKAGNWTQYVTNDLRSSARMECTVSTNAIMHWYKHLSGEPPKRILYLSGQSPVFDDSGDRRRFQAWKHANEPRYVLTIDYLTSRDSGTYYCDRKNNSTL
uniref:Ig-like domain-containing protein n=1 Tax=Buteo japonicus TaxID=224669 RepID=A0A8C0AVN6_9AVES